MVYDVIIIGSGPAGLSAGIYAGRAGLNTLIIEQNYVCGGQIINTYEVDNYPGFMGVTGFELGQSFKQHADKFGLNFVTDEVSKIEIDSEIKKVHTNGGILEGRTLIIATGTSRRKLEIPGEEELCGMGVSYCATCDGAFFKNKEVVVVGGGDVAVEDAIFLARTSKKVYLVHRRDELRSSKILQKKLFSLDNVEIIWDTVVEKIEGTDHVEGVSLYNKKTDKHQELKVDGIFIAVGIIANGEFVKEILQTDEQGYIVADETCETNVPGVFAAGDVRTKPLRQVVTACADGANAITAVEKYLINVN